MDLMSANLDHVELEIAEIEELHPTCHTLEVVESEELAPTCHQ